VTAHLRILLQARIAGLRNRWSRQATSRIALLAAMSLAVCAGALGLGELAWEGLAEAPEDVATMRLGDQPIAGENALEAAFWLTFLAASVLGFRVMEILFRRGEMRMLDRLPIAPAALFIDRAAVALSEAIVAAIPVSLFFTPLAIHGHGWAAASAVLLVVCGMICTTAICLGANIYIGVQFGAPQARGLSDAYGGSGGAFIYGPAAGMFGSAVAALVLKLAAGDVLKAEGWSNAVGLGAGLAFAFAGVLFFTGLRDYRRGAHLVTAWFNEADSVGFEAVIDYQTSSWAHDGWEMRLPGHASAVYRRLALELPRRHPLARWVYGLGAAACLIGFWAASAEAFPVWVPQAVATALLGVVLPPWTHARGLPGADGYDWLPISQDEERLAAGIRAMLVGLAAAGALAVAMVAGNLLGAREFDVQFMLVAAQMLLLPIAATGTLLVVDYERWGLAGRIVPSVLGAGALGTVFVSGTAAAIGCGALAVISLPILRAMLAGAPSPAGAQT
jgi:hypothetical protein